MLNIRVPDRVSRVVSMTIVIVPGEPWVSIQDGDDDGNGYGVDDGSQNSWTDEWTGG